MDDRLIKKETLTDIADAIREKKETTDRIDPSAFAAEIRSIEGGGEDVPSYDGDITVDEGATATFTDDYTEGKAAGITEGIEQGKQDEREAFWGGFQRNGTRNSYRYAFYSQGTDVWTDELYDPLYPITATENYGGDSMYQASQITDTKVPISIGANASYTFLNCAFLVTIIKLIVSEITTFARWFDGCVSLINLTVEGVIAQNGLDLRWSTKLSRASITSVINALSTATDGLTVTFSLTAVNKAFETAEGANDGSTSAAWLALVATRENWTIALG